MKQNQFESDPKDLSERTESFDLTPSGLPAAQLITSPFLMPVIQTPPDIFQNKEVVNPLTAAAEPLLTWASHLREQQQAPDLKELYKTLFQEIKIFENRVYGLGYRSQVILAARYLLCALLDEIILTRPWGKHSIWETQNLMNAFHREAWGSEHFFLILERSSEDLTLYIDVLELGYICLNLGYLGKYRKYEDRQELNTYLDNLYNLIQQYRRKFSQSLFIEPQKRKPKKYRRWPISLAWFVTFLVLTALLIIFIPSYLKLEKMSQPIRDAIENIIKQNQGP